MKCIIFGRHSWLGHKIREYLISYGYNVTLSSCDVTDLPAIWKELKPDYDIVINCAGKTGIPNIDWCEDHKPETFAVNTIGPLNLITVCQEKKIYMVHLGSGCIFDGVGYDKPITEDAPASPPSFYSWTKYWADEILKHFPVLILRIRMPVDSYPNPRNLITKLTRYQKIIDVENSITIVEDFLVALKVLINKKKTGIYNVVNPGSINHKEILELYKKFVNPRHNYELIKPEELKSLGLVKASRSNCILSTNKLEKEGIKLRPIKIGLEQTIKEYSNHV